MPIMLGKGLQATGIILEGTGLYLAFKSLGILSDRRMKNVKIAANPWELAREQIEEQLKEQIISLLWIAVGLVFQIIGFFFT